MLARHGLRLTQRGEAVIFMLVFIAAGVIGMLMPNANEWLTCDSVSMESPIIQSEWDFLMTQGWKGKPDDSMERLYSPGCF